MEKSILTSIKKLLGITEEYNHFDEDLIMHINSVLMILTQLGVGPKTGFMIEDKSTTWSDYLPEATNLQSVMTYVYLRVRLLFDPPTSSAAMEALNRQISEYEWRLNVVAEST